MQTPQLTLAAPAWSEASQMLVARDLDPDVELCQDHLTADAVVATPDWPLEQAAAAMMAGGFRHLVVCSADGAGEVVGVLSVRDLLRVWSAQQRALHYA